MFKNFFKDYSWVNIFPLALVAILLYLAFSAFFL